MENKTKVLILAGGESKRMGHNKAFIRYHDKPQVLHLAEILRKLDQEVHFSFQEDSENQGLERQSIIVDSPKWKGHGPISGLLGAFEAFPDSDWMVIACDYPLLDEQTLYDFLVFTHKEPDSVAAFRASDEGFFEPLLAYYPAVSYQLLLEHIHSGDDSLQHFLQKMNTRSFNPENKNSILNSNTINEMLQIQLDIKRSGSTEMNKTVKIDRISKNGNLRMDDFLVVEEPLEIRVTYPKNGSIVEKSIAVTMRTPGMDEALAAGFLFTEGLVKDFKAVKKVEKVTFDSQTVLVHLDENALNEGIQSERQFFMSSSCGICGKGSIESVRTQSSYPFTADNILISSKIIMQFPEAIQEYQKTFERTGGLHAAALFTFRGELVYLTEDIGRHNAVDKLTGHCWLQGLLPLDNYILLLSGRGGFELIQKAYMAGIKIVVSIGAPSSLAVEMAMEAEMTLIGFLKADKMNVYSGKQRIVS